VLCVNEEAEYYNRHAFVVKHVSLALMLMFVYPVRYYRNDKYEKLKVFVVELNPLAEFAGYAVVLQWHQYGCAHD
jgi:hypothetical protein